MKNLTFGQALDAVKEGRLIAREGWNGKGMFVFMRPADSLKRIDVIDKVKSVPSALKAYLNKEIESAAPEFANDIAEASIQFTAYLCLKAADGSIVNGWLPSQTDMLSNDWCVLE